MDTLVGKSERLSNPLRFHLAVPNAGIKNAERYHEYCAKDSVEGVPGYDQSQHGIAGSLDPIQVMLRRVLAHQQHDSGVAVEWREASAVELPFTEAAFDVVLCQSGLQFFPDRPASLREMHRVLKPGGRLILSVWGPIERSRGFAVAADALARHIGPEAARPITSGAFGLSDADELRALVTGANFKDITVRASVKILRYPSPDEFILRHITGSPLGSAPSPGADDQICSGRSP